MMACHQTCVDIGKRCNYLVRRSSCADCGKVGDCKYFVSSNFVCPCDNNKPTIPVPADCVPCAANNTTKPNNEKRDSSPTRATTQPTQKPNDSDKQTFWQWLLSLIGLGKKNEVGKDSYKNAPTSELTAKFQIADENDAQIKEKDQVGSLDKQEKRRDTQNTETPLGSLAEEVKVEKVKDNKTKAKHKSPRKRRSQSADTKSRNKYLGRPLEPSPPSKRKPLPAKSPPSSKVYKRFSDSGKATPEVSVPALASESKAVSPNTENPVSKQTEAVAVEQPAQAKRPPTSPVYSSEKHLQPYQPTCDQNPPKPISNTCDAPPIHSCPTCVEPFEKSFASMSCPDPNYISTCICQTSPESCCNPKPCCQPSITSLMRKRCPSPSKICKRRSKSCTSPRCINECAALIKKEMKPRRRQNACQMCCISSSGRCYCCTPVSCKDVKCSPPSCMIKCQCCPKPPEPPSSPKPCSNLCQPPPSLKSALPITSSCYGKCPITCMRPCCVPMPVTTFSRCPSAKAICPPSTCCSPSIKTHTASSIPKPSSITSHFPPFCSTFCSPNSLKSYARSKDGDAYCKFLMSRYNVSVPDDPPLYPMTLSGCSPLPPVSMAVQECKRPCFTTRCSDTANATGNYSEQEYDAGESNSKANQQTETVLYNVSPSKKQPVSAFRLPKRTPVECIREQGPRSPVREYTSKLGLPNKQHRPSPPPPIKSNQELAPESGEKPIESKQKGKSPKKKKVSTPKEGEVIPEENAEGEQNVAEQNKSENKTTSDSGTAINNNSQIQQVSFASSESRKVQRVKYTKKISSKHYSPVKEYTTVTSNERTKNGGSFYRNFLDISPRYHLTKRSSDFIKYTNSQSPTFSKRPSIAGSPAQFQRANSISPMVLKKNSVPCNMAANTSRIPKGSQGVSINSLLHRSPHPEPKLPSPRRADKVSLLYKEKSFLIESNSGQPSSSKRNRKVESPQIAKMVKQSNRGYQDLYIQSAERAYNKAILQREKSELERDEKSPCPFDDKEIMIHSLEPSPRIRSAPRISRSVSPRRTNRKKNFSDQPLESNRKIESATANSKSISNEITVLRDEIVALLNDSEDDLPDEDSLKTDTTECLTDGIASDFVGKQRTNKKIGPVPKSENELPLLQIKAPVKLASPYREYDGSSSVDGACINEISDRIFPEKTKCPQKQFPFTRHCESSVDPTTYGMIGESCVDPATFHSDGSIQCCHFHTKSSDPNYSNNHLGDGAQTSTSVDGCDSVPDYHKDASNNYDTDNGGGIENRETAGDIENKHSTVLSQQKEPKSEPANHVHSSNAKPSVSNSGIGRIFNRLRDEVCTNHYGIGFYKSSSVDGVEKGDLCNNTISQESDVDGADFKKSLRSRDTMVMSGGVSERSGNISNNNRDNDDDDDVNDEGEKINDPTYTLGVNGEADPILNNDEVVVVDDDDDDDDDNDGDDGTTGKELRNVSQAIAENAAMTGACSVPIEPATLEEENADIAEGNGVKENDGQFTPKPSLIQELLSHSGVKWQKVGPATETDIKIMRIAKAALMTTASTACDKADSLPPYSIMFKSQCDDQEGINDFRSVLLKPKEKEGEEQSVLSRINDF